MATTHKIVSAGGRATHLVAVMPSATGGALTKCGLHVTAAAGAGVPTCAKCKRTAGIVR